jgi:hypothetical protein
MRRAPILAWTKAGRRPGAWRGNAAPKPSSRRNDRARAGLSRSKPRPRRSEAGPFCQEPGWERNNVVFKSDVGGRRHAEVIERRARPGRGWRKGVGRCQRRENYERTETRHDSIIQPPAIAISDLFHWEKTLQMERLVEGPLDVIAASRSGCGIQRNAVTRF